MGAGFPSGSVGSLICQLLDASFWVEQIAPCKKKKKV